MMNVTPLVIASYVVSAEQPSGVKLPPWEIYIGQRGLQHCRKADMYRHFVTLSSRVAERCHAFCPVPHRRSSTYPYEGILATRTTLVVVALDLD